MVKRRNTLGIVALVLTVIALWNVFSAPTPAQISEIKESFAQKISPTSAAPAVHIQTSPAQDPAMDQPVKKSGDLNELVKGKPIMSKMKNETIRAEVGNAGWKLFHTILAQYPEEPDQDARDTLHNYIRLFSRVYPCRECAEHFQELIREYPPQLSSRKVAVLWGCDAHNKVNKRLGKEIFDCAYIDDKYDCGCGGDEDEEETSSGDASKAKETLTPMKGG